MKPSKNDLEFSDQHLMGGALVAAFVCGCASLLLIALSATVYSWVWP